MLSILNLPVLADENTEAIKFFKKYINAANNYDSSVLNMYSPDAKIIRQVIKPDGELVDVETDTETYLRQLKIGQKTAKFRRYKNNYSNITSQKVSNGYKISALRQPSGERYKLRSYTIVQKQPNGEWKIVEELMQTKVQLFLKYANR
jgi:ketosteroid isomerase-like protein